MARLPDFLQVTTGPSERCANGALMMPFRVTIRRRSLAWARFLWSTGRSQHVPRRKLAAIVGRQVLTR